MSATELVQPGRECTKCGERRRAEMVPRKNSPDGHDRCCRACNRARAAAWRGENRDRHRAYSRTYREVHPEDQERRAQYTREWRAANPDQFRGYRLRRFGLTPADYDEILVRQGGACALCRHAPGPDDRALAVDHDHRCCPGTGSCGNCVRGLLCAKCNTALGLLREDPEILRAAAQYLEDCK